MSSVKLQRYDGTGDVDAFLAHFEVVATANGWTKDVQLLQLPTALDGSAFNCYRKLPVDQRDTIVKLKDCLQTEFRQCFLDTDYAAQLAVRKREQGESLQDFGEAILDLSQKTYKKFNETQIDAVCRTHFINGVGDMIRVHLLVGSQEYLEIKVVIISLVCPFSAARCMAVFLHRFLVPI